MNLKYNINFEIIKNGEDSVITDPKIFLQDMLKDYVDLDGITANKILIKKFEDKGDSYRFIVYIDLSVSVLKAMKYKNKDMLQEAFKKLEGKGFLPGKYMAEKAS